MNSMTIPINETLALGFNESAIHTGANYAKDNRRLARAETLLRDRLVRAAHRLGNVPPEDYNYAKTASVSNAVILLFVRLKLRQIPLEHPIYAHVCECDKLAMQLSICVNILREGNALFHDLSVEQLISRAKQLSTDIKKAARYLKPKMTTAVL